MRMQLRELNSSKHYRDIKMAKIETEFDVTDRVYFIDKNSIIQGEIRSIDIKITFANYEVSYLIDNGTKSGTKRKESLVFKSVDEIVRKYNEEK